MKRFIFVILAALLLTGCANKNAQVDPSADLHGAQFISLSNERSFYVKIPERSEPVPVIIALHGRGQTGKAWLSSEKGDERFDHEGQGLFTEAALQEGFAVIAPNAAVPFCADSGPTQWEYSKSSADLAFFNELFAYIKKNPKLDASRIYVTGISSGGFMTSRLALEFPDEIRAVAIHSAGSADKSVQSEEKRLRCSAPVSFDTSVLEALQQPPTLLLHGEDDVLVPTQMSIEYDKALTNANVEHKLILVPDKGHEWFSEHNQDILDWFTQH